MKPGDLERISLRYMMQTADGRIGALWHRNMPGL
jgi:hypothetical protein